MANLQRKDLNAVEEAEHFQLLIDKFGYSQAKIAAEFGVDSSQVCNRLRLLQLPKEWRERVVKGELPATHARSLVPFAKYPKILDRMKSVLKDDLSLTDWNEEVESAVEELSRHLAGSEWYREVGSSTSRSSRRPSSSSSSTWCVRPRQAEMRPER